MKLLLRAKGHQRPSPPRPSCTSSNPGLLSEHVEVVQNLGIMGTLRMHGDYKGIMKVPVRQ